MLRRTLAAGLVVLLAWQAAPAVAAGSVDGVTVAWTDTTHTKIRITWTEDPGIANTLRMELGWWEEPLALGSVAATAPNELVINSSYLGYTGSSEDRAEIVVADSTGTEARSAAFDRYVRPSPMPTLSITPARAVRWTVPEVEDPTPNDALDLPGSSRFTPKLLLDKQPHTVADCGELALQSTTGLSGEVPDQGKPGSLTLLSSNEWNPRGVGNDPAGIATTGLTVAGPTSTQYGGSLVLSGTVRYQYISTNSSNICKQTSYLMPSERLVLQGRNTATSAWYVIGTTTTNVDGQYTVTLKNAGAREYRVVRPDTSSFNAIQYGAWSPAKLVRATTKVVSAKFIAPVITLGTQPQAYLWVDPAGTQKAALQFKNASGVWQGITYKTLYAGRGIAAFTFNRKGATQFRWWVPGSTTSTGLTVDAVYSSPFTLTVR